MLSCGKSISEYNAPPQKHYTTTAPMLMIGFISPWYSLITTINVGYIFVSYVFVISLSKVTLNVYSPSGHVNLSKNGLDCLISSFGPRICFFWIWFCYPGQILRQAPRDYWHLCFLYGIKAVGERLKLERKHRNILPPGLLYHHWLVFYFLNS